jgi:hypothetical protein
MSIETVQKQRFLNTIFKIYHSLGVNPNYDDISVLFGQYFSLNQPGNPVKVPYEDLNASNTIDINGLNKIMSTLLFNVDVLYDSFHEDVESLYSIMSSYKFRLENLKNKRAEVEKKIDDHLFAIKNTDGFYYSITNAFNDLDQTDIENTSAYVDTEAKKTVLPKMSSGVFNYVGNLLSTASAVDVSIFFNGERKDFRQGVDFANAFNGLNNSRWSYTSQDGSNGYMSAEIGLCTLKISVPTSSLQSSAISVVEGKIVSRKAVDTSVIVRDSIDVSNSLYFTKSGSTDYDTFSFNFEPKSTSTIEIFFAKAEPDYFIIQEDQTKRYVYEFSIDELVIAAPYYNASAQFYSNRMEIVDNKNKNILVDAVSLDADNQIPEGCAINYYIAVDNGSQQDPKTLDWLAISPSSRSVSSEENIVRFNGTTNRSIRVIDLPQNATSIVSSTSGLVRIPRTTQYSNPIANYFYQNDSNILGFNLYRLAKIPEGIDPITPYILENTYSRQLKVHSVQGTSLDQASWQEVLAGLRNEVVLTTDSQDISSNDLFFSANNIPNGSIRLSTNVYADSDVLFNKKFLKSIDAQYWDVNIFLNGRQLARVEPGTLFAPVAWNFVRGQNSIVIIINKSTDSINNSSTFQGSISLMEGMSIVNTVGIKAYENYLFYVKIEDLRRLYSNTDNVFSIIKYENNNEIVYRRTEEIRSGSVVSYLENINNGISGLRLRADLSRGQTAYSSPALISYKLKFRH